MKNENEQSTLDVNSPLVHLQWFAEEDMTPLEGPGEPTPAAGGPGDKFASAGQPVSMESYFYEHPETGHRFKTKEDLDKDWKRSFMMQSDYSKKTAEVANQRKQFESERADFERVKKAFEEERALTKKEMESYDKIIRNNPKAYAYLKKLKEEQLNGTGGLDQSAIDRVIDQKYGDKFKKIEEWESNQQAEQQKKEAVEALKLMYEDFDFDAVDKSYQDLVANGNLQSLMELIHFANKGRSLNPSDLERQFTEKLQKKQAGKIISSEGTSTGGKPKAHSSMDAAISAALMDAKRK